MTEDKEEVTEVKDTGNETDTADTKTPSSFNLMNILVIVVIAAISTLCAFIFVTRFYSSKDVYNLANVTEATTVDDTGNISSENSGKKQMENGDRGKAEGESKKQNDTGSNEKINSLKEKILVPIDSIVVNLGEVDSKRYLRVIISLEVDSIETENIIKKNKVVFRDKLVSFLSTKNADDIGTPSNQLGLRTKIKDLFNNELLGTKEAISQVYFSDFIIQ